MKIGLSFKSEHIKLFKGHRTSIYLDEMLIKTLYNNTFFLNIKIIHLGAFTFLSLKYTLPSLNYNIL